MDKLRTYFEETGETTSSLAARMGCAPTTLTRPLRGERNASMGVALDVERATEGRVPALDFLAICLDARRRHDAATAESTSSVAAE